MNIIKCQQQKEKSLRSQINLFNLFKREALKFHNAIAIKSIYLFLVAKSYQLFQCHLVDVDIIFQQNRENRTKQGNKKINKI